MSFKVVCTCNIPFVVKGFGEGIRGVAFVDEKALYAPLTSGDIAGALPKTSPASYPENGYRD